MAPRINRKRTHAQIRTDIPEEDAVVTHVEVTRDVNHKILAKSTKVSIPVASAIPSQHIPLQDPETLPSALDDDPAPTAKKARKGPSRSVAVYSFLFLSSDTR